MSNKKPRNQMVEPKTNTEVEEKEPFDLWETPVEAEESAPEVTEEVVTEASEPLVGMVANCSKLNLRKDPSKENEPLLVLTAGTRVTVYPERSTDTWYFVKVNSVEGYCMKDYVTIS